MEKKFKVGDKVKYDGIESFKGEIGEIIIIDNTSCNEYGVKFNNINSPLHSLNGKCKDCYGWWCDEDELELAQIEVGDTVRINKNATIEDFTKNWWNGCQMDTLKFLERHGRENGNFIVDKVTKSYLELRNERGNNGRLLCVNINIFELVKKKKEPKEITMEELNKILGYEVKIVEKKGSEGNGN